MKFAVLFALVCISYANSESVMDLGNTKGRAINIEYVVADRQMFKIQNRTVTIPRVRNIFQFRMKKQKIKNIFIFAFPKTTWPLEIVGIRHINNEPMPVEAKIIGGGIGHKSVTINLISIRGQGINSTFLFYGKF